MPLESNLDIPIIKGVKKMRLSVLFFTRKEETTPSAISVIVMAPL